MLKNSIRPCSCGEVFSDDLCRVAGIANSLEVNRTALTVPSAHGSRIVARPSEAPRDQPEGEESRPTLFLSLCWLPNPELKKRQSLLARPASQRRRPARGIPASRVIGRCPGLAQGSGLAMARRFQPFSIALPINQGFPCILSYITFLVALGNPVNSFLSL